MPYIKREMRDKLNPAILEIVKTIRAQGATAGQLAYVVYSLLQAFGSAPPQTFTELATYTGAVEGALAEYRRIDMAAYEDEKMAANGPADDFVYVVGESGKGGYVCGL